MVFYWKKTKKQQWKNSVWNRIKVVRFTAIDDSHDMWLMVRISSRFFSIWWLLEGILYQLHVDTLTHTNVLHLWIRRSAKVRQYAWDDEEETHSSTLRNTKHHQTGTPNGGRRVITNRHTHYCCCWLLLFLFKTVSCGSTHDDNDAKPNWRSVPVVWRKKERNLAVYAVPLLAAAGREWVVNPGRDFSRYRKRCNTRCNNTRRLLVRVRRRRIGC